MPIFSILSGLRRWGHFLSQLCFPGLCLLCGEELLCEIEDSIPLCHPCRGRFPDRMKGPVCRVCSRLLLAEQDICVYCRRREYFFDQHRSHFDYTGIVRELLYQYKSGAVRQLALFLAAFFKPPPGTTPDSYLLVPVPGNPASVRERGWDHMEVLAELLSVRWACPFLACLGRKKGRSQKELGFLARSENLVNRIYLKKRHTVAGREIILLDDVFTTGATLSQCARILKEAGASGVQGLTFAQD